MSVRHVVPPSEAQWLLAPAPAWVEAREPDWSFAPAGDAPVAFLLLDEQHQVATQALAQRTVRRVLTLSAVQSLGQVEIEFDPAAHRLIVHELAVCRIDAEGRWQRRPVTERGAFLLRQREQQLEQQMLNGRVSLVALLEDLRIGDAIDLAWTLEPVEQLPGMRFTTFYAFVWTVPVARAFLTLHLTAEVPLRWRMHVPAGVTPPHEQVTPTRAEFSIDRPAKFQPEPNVPVGSWPFAVFEATAWSSWTEVAAFCSGLCADALAEDGELVAAEAERLKGGDDLSVAIRRAIQFVQEEVRYLAVDFGHGGGFLPNGAGTVLRRRFGDCKDKSVLLAALLRALGVEAWPMLVGSNLRDAVRRLMPSHAIFNHAIVSFVAVGAQRFVDPTLVGQGGDLARLSVPPYGCGLELRPGTCELTTLPEPVLAELTLSETFDLDRRQRGGRVDQSLRASAWLADDVRASLVRQGELAFFKARADGLQQHFPALVTPPERCVSSDDRAANIIDCSSHYLLPTWGQPGQKPPALFAYGAHGLFLAVERLNNREPRRQPFALRHPMKVRHRVVVRGKPVRKAKPERHEFAGPGFRYSCVVTSRRREVTFDYCWESAAREVPPERWQEYCDERTRALERASAVVATSGNSALWLRIGIVVFAALAGLVNGYLKNHQGSAVDGSQRQAIERDAGAAFDAMRQGKSVEAWTIVERITPYFDRNFDFQALRAEAATRTGHLDVARAALDQARQLKSDDPMVDLLDGLLHETAGDFPAARAILEQSLARHPGNDRAWFDLARITERMGDTRAARAAWEAVLSRQPAQPDALFGLARLLYSAGEQDEADAVITRAIAALPTGSAVLEAALARYYAATGRPAAAVAPARRATELAPDVPIYARQYVMALLGASDTAAAVAVAQRATERYPQDGYAWSALATAAAMARDPTLADSAFQQWLKLAPDDPNAQSSYGYHLHREGRDDDARVVLERAVQSFPGNGVVWLNYAVVLDALGRSSEAQAARQKANALLTDEERATLVR